MDTVLLAPVVESASLVGALDGVDAFDVWTADIVEEDVGLEAICGALDVKLLSKVDCWLEDVDTVWYEEVEVAMLAAVVGLVGNRLEKDPWEAWVLWVATVGVLRVPIGVEGYTLELVPLWALDKPLLVVL